MHLPRALLALSIVLAAGCREFDRKEFDELEHQTVQSYRGNDIAAAERALLEYRTAIARAKSCKVKRYNFDFMMAANASRLFDLYAFRKDDEKAAFYLKEAVAYFNAAFPDERVEFSKIRAERDIQDFLRVVEPIAPAWKQKAQPAHSFDRPVFDR